ncbi:hypothetical protein [Lignipirellula cremea]|uniref:Secreted protein n=1 Tax=Lignipirellula cremea TaxID=2528010 RepID=A0A518DT92_9BACT|nr:hypothetical protein [Lignipirellula cremea]QDU95059.1 hypothetical protein Pla8534_28710 [Lignipirellula cremea]
MQFLATRLLITALVLHATFGCCFHHAHALESTCCNASTASSASRRSPPSCCCTGHAEDVDLSTALVLEPAPTSDQPACPGSHDCDGVKCNFARTEISPENEISSVTSLLLLPLRLQECVVPSTVTASVVPDGMQPLRPLRLHLFLAVLRL